MSKKAVNIITIISAIIVIIAFALAYLKFDIRIWMPLVILSMILSRIMMYILKKREKEEQE